MSELRFPNVKDESEDPALVMARKSLERKKPEPKVKAKKGVKTCWRCKEPVGKENLTQKWIRRLNAQRFLCDDCIPYKDEEFTGRPEAHISLPLKIDVKSKAKPLPEIQQVRRQVTRVHSGVFIKFKECFKCDCTLFFVMKGGVVKCSECESEYSL